MARLIATPAGLPLFNAMLPPRALRRLDLAKAGSDEETSIREVTATESLVEVRFTVPPLACGENGDCADHKGLMEDSVAHRRCHAPRAMSCEQHLMV